MFPVKEQTISSEKANEYMQVAGLLSNDVDLLHDMAHNDNMSKEDLIGQIDLLHEHMVSMTTDKASREDRWGAFLALWGLMGLAPDTGETNEPHQFNISGNSE